MKLIVDMNLSPNWATFLTKAGFVAAHWTTLGAVDASDHEIMNFARLNDFVVLTHDLDFGAIPAATQGEKPSVVQIRAYDLTTVAIGAVVVTALKQLAHDLEAGALVTIDPNRTRLRLLPLLQRD